MYLRVSIVAILVSLASVTDCSSRVSCIFPSSVSFRLHPGWCCAVQISLSCLLLYLQSTVTLRINSMWLIESCQTKLLPLVLSFTYFIFLSVPFLPIVSTYPFQASSHPYNVSSSHLQSWSIHPTVLTQYINSSVPGWPSSVYPQWFPFL